jgi:16S rRNA (guanine966-N2)-methyltransferase
MNAGEWRGRQVQAPPGETTRPTADRTRETLFSMLVSRLGSFEGLAVADLFAGSGALGLEALSRGAGPVALDKLARLGWIGPASWVSLETAHDEPLALKGIVLDAERRVGKARLNLLRLAA